MERPLYGNSNPYKEFCKVIFAPDGYASWTLLVGLFLKTGRKLCGDSSSDRVNMNVMLLLLLVALVLQHPGGVGGQFTAPLLSPSCPSDPFTFQCTVEGDSNGITIWSVGGSECILSHRDPNDRETCGLERVFVARFSTITATSFTSTLSCGMTPIHLDGTLVECFGPDIPRNAENMVGNSTLQIVGLPSLPSLSCVDLSGDTNGALSVTVSWTLSGADFYLIDITTNDPQPPYGGLLNVSNASVTQRELTGFQAGYEYTITVRGVNCGNQTGNESEPLTITPQVPTPPSLNVCAEYNRTTRTLQTIESTWNEVGSVIILRGCGSIQDGGFIYTISYETESDTTMVSLNPQDCSNSICQHLFPVQQRASYNVSVAARNVVGQSESNTVSVGVTNMLTVNVDTTNTENAFVNCMFMSNPVYSCTIVYGEDPSYTNLVYSDTSTTEDEETTITLSQDLQTDTTYYFIVTANSSSRCERVRGSFQTAGGGTPGDVTPTSGGVSVTVVVVVLVVVVVVVVLLL